MANFAKATRAFSPPLNSVIGFSTSSPENKKLPNILRISTSGVVLWSSQSHYFFAKRAGILVREFAIGMGPKLFAHQAKDGTTYTIRMLPLGGYVQMAGWGEDETELTPGMPVSLVQDATGKVIKINTSKKIQLPQAIPMEVTDFDLEEKLTITGFINGNEQEAVTYAVDHDATIIHEDGVEVRIAPKDVQFQSAKLWQRMLTNFAGPMNNFILSLVLFTGLVFAQGGVANQDATIVTGIEAGTPAAEAGLQNGDEILAVEGVDVSNWSELTTEIQKYPYFDHYQFDDCDQHFTDHPVYQISVGIHYVSNLAADYNDVSFRFESIFHSVDLDPRKWRTRDRCLRQ